MFRGGSSLPCVGILKKRPSANAPVVRWVEHAQAQLRNIDFSSLSYRIYDKKKNWLLFFTIKIA